MCPLCNGTGFILHVDIDGDFLYWEEELCPCMMYFDWDLDIY